MGPSDTVQNGRNGNANTHTYTHSPYPPTYSNSNLAQEKANTVFYGEPYQPTTVVVDQYDQYDGEDQFDEEDDQIENYDGTHGNFTNTAEQQTGMVRHPQGHPSPATHSHSSGNPFDSPVENIQQSQSPVYNREKNCFENTMNISQNIPPQHENILNNISHQPREIFTPNLWGRRQSIHPVTGETKWTDFPNQTAERLLSKSLPQATLDIIKTGYNKIKSHNPAHMREQQSFPTLTSASNINMWIDEIMTDGMLNGWNEEHIILKANQMFRRSKNAICEKVYNNIHTLKSVGRPPTTMMELFQVVYWSVYSDETKELQYLTYNRITQSAGDSIASYFKKYEAARQDAGYPLSGTAELAHFKNSIRETYRMAWVDYLSQNPGVILRTVEDAVRMLDNIESRSWTLDNYEQYFQRKKQQQQPKQPPPQQQVQQVRQHNNQNNQQPRQPPRVAQPQQPNNRYNNNNYNNNNNRYNNNNNNKGNQQPQHNNQDNRRTPPRYDNRSPPPGNNNSGYSGNRLPTSALGGSVPPNTSNIPCTLCGKKGHHPRECTTPIEHRNLTAANKALEEFLKQPPRSRQPQNNNRGGRGGRGDRGRGGRTGRGQPVHHVQGEQQLAEPSNPAEQTPPTNYYPAVTNYQM
ncbi:MAG: hypothetical protein DHS20C09_11770 [marine bacterium B5-7]|nr:MAG: hypothetical protein DHS20C09_11770 [marine bacterium B5-7]